MDKKEKNEFVTPFILNAPKLKFKVPIKKPTPFSLSESSKQGVDVTTGEEWSRGLSQRGFVSLADIFDIEPDTEQDIKDVLKTVGVIATILIAGGAIGCDDDKEE